MISLTPEILFYIGKLPVTNTLIDTLVVDGLLITACYFITKKISLIPNYFQNLIELIIDFVYNLTESIAETHVKKIFPYFMTFFLFVLVSNWTGLIPILNSVGFFDGGNFTPLVRSTSTDLNTTLALALVSLTATHTMSLRTLGIKEWITRYLSFNPFNLFIGLLELVSEFTKIISFSFRLFGNIYVGEVMLAQLAAAFAFLLPVPLILYEIAVGVIQAVIFGMLTMAFMAIMTTPHHVEAKEVST